METTTESTPAARAPRKIERTPLKTICASLRIEPKAARRKLRAAGLSFHAARERWTFTESQAARVREILKESDIERLPARKPAARKAKPADAPAATA